MIQVGIIGFGKMGRIRQETLDASKRAKVVAIAEPGATDLPARSMSAEEILRSPDIDAVFICTPNYLNKPLTVEALDRGKHVFCEKPPALNGAEVREIIDAEQRSGGLKLMYGFNHRHHESVQHIKETIDSGQAGNILWMRGRYGKSVDESFYKTWRARRDLAGGGILIDQGIHMLDLFLYMAGEFDDVHAFVSDLYWRMDVEDNVFAIMRNSRTNVVASLHSTMTQWRHLFSLEIFCERGYFVLNGLRTSSRSYGEEILSIAKDRSPPPAARWSDEEQIHYQVDESWASEISQFLDTIELDQPVRLGTSADALKIMCLIDRIYAQTKT